MKSLPILVAAAAVTFAVPVQADVVHQTSVVHEGREIAVTYEPQVETKVRQVGIGPRSALNCTWKSEVSVRRTALDASMRPIAALTRVVDGAAPRSGSQLGLCATVSSRQTAAFGGDEAKLRSFLADVAASDLATLRTEFASLNALHPSSSHAR